MPSNIAESLSFLHNIRIMGYSCIIHYNNIISNEEDATLAR